MRLEPTLRSTNPQEIQRGRPAFATSQREKILELLRQAGSRGVRREDLLYVRRWSQAGARIHELERMGYVIEHVWEPNAKFVTYRLISEPACEKPLPNFERKQSEIVQGTFDNSDWYTQQTGQPRPRTVRHKFPNLPLFEASEQ